MSAPHVAYVVLDVNDLDAQAKFWSQLLGVDIDGRVEQYVILEPTG